MLQNVLVITLLCCYAVESARVQSLQNSDVGADAALESCSDAALEPFHNDLVARYDFNDQGSHVKDTSGNCRDGRLDNAVRIHPDTKAAGVLRVAANRAQKVILPSSACVGGANPRTIALWYRTNASALDKAYLFAFGNNVNNCHKHQTFNGRFINDKLGFMGCSDDYDPGPIGAGLTNDGQWKFIVYTYDGRWVKAYVNGREIWVVEKPALVTNCDVAYIGAHNGKLAHVRKWSAGGDIDNFRIYRRALSKENIATLFDFDSATTTTSTTTATTTAPTIPPTTAVPDPVPYSCSQAAPDPFLHDLVARYEMESKGSRIIDTSGNCRHGTLENAGFINDGVQGRALRFGLNGRSRVILPSTACVSGRNDRTVAFWYRTTNDVGKGQYAFAFGAKHHRCLRKTSFNGRFSTGAHVAFMGCAADYDVPKGKKINDGNWHFIVYTYSGDVVRNFVDGAPDGKPNWEMKSNLTTRCDVAYISSHTGGGDSHTGASGGDIDSFRIYSRALSETEIEELKHFEKPTCAPRWGTCTTLECCSPEDRCVMTDQGFSQCRLAGLAQ